MKPRLFSDRDPHKIVICVLCSLSLRRRKWLLRDYGVNSGVQSLLKTPVSPPSPTPAFVKGQLWQLLDATRFIKIGHVGRLLVHHRTVVPSLKRSISRETLSSIKDLLQILAANKAVLVQN